MTEAIIDRASTLLVLFVRNKLNKVEQEELNALCAGYPAVKNLKVRLSSRFWIDDEMEWKDREDRMWQKMLEIQRRKGGNENNNGQIVPINRLQWLRYAVAAAALIATLLLVFYFSDTYTKDSEIINKQASTVDRFPAGDLATLQLADGSVIVLDSAGNGNLAQEGSVTIKKMNGSVVYGTNNKENKLAYNLITTPRGGRYQVILPDGTKVWLNASTFLRFPAAFVNKERLVYLQGEAYFDVAHDVNKPFIVQVGNTRIAALGTSFNIKAFSDETNLKATLLTGKVAVTMQEDRLILIPGEQAVVSGKNLERKSGVDVDEVMAWKNGYFMFTETEVQSIFKDISRWYNVDVSFEGAPPVRRLTGVISRNKKLSVVLEMLDQFGIKTRMEKEKIVVLPQ